MAVTTTNLGVITAYGDAVAAGYTGTKAEWQTLMASYATVGQQAVDAKNAAVAAKDTAVSKATEATTAANTATTKANEASASAQSIAQSASQIAQNTSDISELKEEIVQLEDDGQGYLKGAFINGSLSSGVVDTSVTFRVTSNDKFVFDRDIVLTPDTGFRFGIHSFGTSGTSFVVDSGWQTTAYKITAGTYFKIVIQEISKTSGVADIPTNVHAVKLSTVISDTIGDYTKFKTSINSDLTSVKNITGISKSETFSYSGNHSSEVDILQIGILSGTTYTVNLTVTGGQSWCSLFYWANGTKTKIGDYTIASAFPLTLTAAANIDGISVYWTGSSSGSATLLVGYKGSLENELTDTIDFIEDCIDQREVLVTLANGTPPNTSNSDCVRTANAIPVKLGDTIEFITDRPLSAGSSKYIYGVYGYNSANSMIVNLGPLDRASKGSKYLVDNPNVETIKYAITELVSGSTVSQLRVGDFSGYSATVKVDGNVFENQYNGEKLSVKKGRYNALKTNLYSPTITDMGSAAPQGFAIYNGKVIQLYSNADKAAIFDLSDGTVAATMASNVGHGNGIDFLSAKADGSDPFPIAIVGEGTSNTAYEVRIQTSGITVRKTIKFPIENAGYYVQTMVDKLNNVLYTVGYVANSYTDDTGNKMIIAKWDYSELTENGDSTYTPQFIEKFNVPFITTIQQPVFFNGRLYILSSKTSNGEADTNIYVIDPYRKTITNILSEFPAPLKNVETEAIYFYDDGTDTYMFVKNYESNVPYYRVVFNS